MTDLQKRILDIYKEVKRICDKYNLKYYAIGGTCIGAIRHKGFIPWDDDLDIAMPIDDYIKFKSIAVNELKAPYNLVDYSDKNRAYFYNPFIKVENKNTTFIEEKELKNPDCFKGVYIDIMPICSCSKNKILKRLQNFRFYKLIKLNQVKHNKLNSFDTIKWKILWIITKPITCLKNNQYYLKKYEELISKYPINEKDDVLFPWRIPPRGSYKNTFPYEYFKDTVELPFEDTTIKCPIDYDGYLKMDFGDYMKIPPKDKQVTHNPPILDLNNSYEKYARGEIKNEYIK